jgi:hypothetical protein
MQSNTVSLQQKQQDHDNNMTDSITRASQTMAKCVQAATVERSLQSQK